MANEDHTRAQREKEIIDFLLGGGPKKNQQKRSRPRTMQTLQGTANRHLCAECIGCGKTKMKSSMTTLKVTPPGERTYRSTQVLGHICRDCMVDLMERFEIKER